MTSYGPRLPDLDQTALIPRQPGPPRAHRPWPYVLVMCGLGLLAMVIAVSGVTVLALFWGAQ